MVKGGKTSVPYLLCPECQSSGNLFILILVVLSKSSLSSIWVFWDLWEGHPGYGEDIAMLFFANLGTPFLSSKDFWHSLYPSHFSYCLWPSPLDLLPCCTGDCARFRWQGFSAGRFRSGSGRNSEEGIRSERWLGKWMKHIETWCFLFNLRTCKNSPEHDEHDGFLEKGVHLLNSFFRRLTKIGGKWRQGNHSIEFEGTLWNTQKHPMFCSYQYLTVSHCEFSCRSR